MPSPGNAVVGRAVAGNLDWFDENCADYFNRLAAS
jgi:hypothetical protein